MLLCGGVVLLSLFLLCFFNVGVVVASKLDLFPIVTYRHFNLFQFLLFVFRSYFIVWLDAIYALSRVVKRKSIVDSRYHDFTI